MELKETKQMTNKMERLKKIERDVKKLREKHRGTEGEIEKILDTMVNLNIAREVLEEDIASTPDPDVNKLKAIIKMNSDLAEGVEYAKAIATSNFMYNVKIQTLTYHLAKLGEEE